jgi:hypothetical protein
MRAVRVLVLLCAAAAVAVPAVAAADEPTRYVVKEGDTCVAIARRFYGDPAQVARIHEVNPRLGPTPHALRPGSVLLLPGVGPRPADAKVTRALGEVRARPPEARDYGPAPVGTELWAAWRVGSGARSAAEVTFRDESRLQMWEQTVVVIYGPGGERTAMGDAVLESGELLARLDELAGRRPLEVATAAAQAQILAGTTLVSAGAGGVTRVANHAGQPALVRGRRAGRPEGAPVAVASGMGSRVDVGQPPTPPRPLPPAPAWAATPRAVPAIDGQHGDVAIAWAPVPAAARYRVLVAADAEARDVRDRVEVGAGVTRFEARGLPLGATYFFVSTVDGEEFVGPPSPPLAVAVTAILVAPPGAPDAAPGTLAAALPLGTVARVPAGLVCQLGDDPPAPVLVFARPGRVALRCRDDAGAASPPVDVEVAPLPVAAAVEGQAGLTARLVVDGPPAVIAGLGVVAPAGVTVRLRAPAAPGRLVADLQGPPGRHEVAVVLAAAGRSVEVARALAELRAPAGPRRPVAEVGFFFVGASHNAGYALGSVEAPVGAWGAGLRGAAILVPKLELELEADARTTSLFGDHGVLLGADLHLVIQPDRSGVRPFALAGLGGEWAPAPGAARATAHVGAGLKLPFEGRAAIRLEGRGRVAADGDLAAELRVGLTLAL